MTLFFRLGIMLSLISLAVFCGCNNQDQTTAITSVSSAKNDLPGDDYQKLDTTLFFSGLWVNERYVNVLRKTKSPSTMEIPEYSCILIPAKTLKETSFIAGFHEGGESLMIFKNGDHYEFWGKEEKKKIADIKFVGEDRMKINEEYFVKLRSGDLSGDPNPFNIVDLILFAGKFHDEMGNIVEFSKDGKLKGLPGTNFYEATLDYADPEPQLDELKLGPAMPDLKSYAFKFNSDTLNIFEVICKEKNWDSVCLESDFGRKYLTLIREK